MQGSVYQTSYGFSRDAAFAGLIEKADDVISRINATRRLYKVLVGGGSDGVYEIKIDGVTVGTFTASTNTAAQIKTNLQADMVTDGTMTVESIDTTSFYLEAKEYGDGPVVTVASTGSTITLTELVPDGQEIPFGVGVVMDPRAAESGLNCRLPRLTGEISAPTFLGIAAADTSRPANAGGWPGRSAVSILRKGRIWCLSETAQSEGANPYCRYGAGTGSQLGAFRNDADSTTAVQAKGLIVVKGCSSAGIFLAEFNPQT